MDKEFDVIQKDAGSRIDKWLCERMSNVSRKQVKDLLDDGRVLVNGKRVVIAGWELMDGDHVEVRLPPSFGSFSSEDITLPDSAASPEAAPNKVEYESVPSIADSIERHLKRKVDRHRAMAAASREQRKGQKRGEKQERGRSEAKDKRIKIYFEDRDVIVVEKPSGIEAVSSKEGASDDMLSQVHAYMKRKFKNAKNSFVHPVHRLDTETSGIMVFALSNVGKQLEEQFKKHSIKREYTALVEGRVDNEHGTIRKALEKGEFGEGKKVRESDEGKTAITEYQVEERYADATLLCVRVQTGRTHQIRVHLSGEGFPIIGDKLYHGDVPMKHRFQRQALHARLLGFRHPRTGRKFQFRSALPGDIKRLIGELRDGKKASS
jgi:23S rRNA pseudouridine1911/1915/1917 synthase